VKSKICITAYTIFGLIILSACGLFSEDPKEDKDSRLYSIYQLAIEAEAFEGTYEEWVESIRGEDGREVLFQVSETHIEWKYEGESEWQSLILLSDLSGPAGEQGLEGKKGIDGLSAYETYVHHHPGYTKGELEWLQELIEGTLSYEPAEIFPFTFDLADETLAITSYTGEGREVHVPSSIAGYPVDSIEAFVFFENEEIESMYIAEGIRNIGRGAFAGMSSLKTLHIPSSVVGMDEEVVFDTPLLEIFSMHSEQPSTWHAHWNPSEVPVAWYLELDYHHIYYEMLTATSFSCHNYGVESDGQFVEANYKLLPQGVFFDHFPPNYYSPDERLTWYFLNEPPSKFQYDMDPMNECYTEKTIIGDHQYLHLLNMMEQIRNYLYVPTMQDEWFERTIYGFTLKEAHLNDIGEQHIPGDVYAYEIRILNNGFSVYANILLPGHDAPSEIWHVYTDINATTLPNLVACEP